MGNIRRVSLMAVVAVALGAALAVVFFGGSTTEAGKVTVNRDKGGSVWGADYFPNVALINHKGETVRFFDDMIKDKVVAINFVYTTCPDACPLETARMLEVSEILGDRLGKDVFFYSITIDPERDTPEVLGQYVENFGIPEGWSFLTGDEDDIILLRRKLGIYIEEIQSDDSNDHNLNLVIGNQSTGRWMKRSPFENSHILASQIGGELHNWKMPPKADRPYAEAPKLRSISKGESLWRTRCASCHTIGEGDVNELADRRIGPDLYDVSARRDRRWLVRWLAEPDKMLEEKDPIAMAMMAKYNDVPMPNMQLNDYEVEMLITYMDRETRRIKQHVEAGHRPDPLAPRVASHGADSHAGHRGGGHAGHDTGEHANLH